MKKEHRDEIKQDELMSGLEKAATWTVAHRDEIRIGAGVVVVLLAAAGAVAYFQGQRAKEADRAFRDALTTFEAPVASELAAGADRPAGQVFATAEEKYKTAAAAFEGVERRFGSSKTGVRAKYYAALSRVQLGQNAEAEKGLKEIQTLGAGLEPELARLALADLYRRSGQVDKAVESYRGMATNPTANVPRDFALLSAAQALEDAKRWPEARAAYRQVYEDFPASVFATEARARVEYLQTLG
ncbi:MAG TPA: tetratricopeptide repeat protein [Vicinamibacteria bacterium]|nr:tetratricopeptide repeat protein [Vicinamibacteria bacterium]